MADTTGCLRTWRFGGCVRSRLARCRWRRTILIVQIMGINVGKFNNIYRRKKHRMDGIIQYYSVNINIYPII